MQLSSVIFHTASDQDEKAKQWFKEKITPFLNPLNLFKSDNSKEYAMVRIIMLKFPELPEVEEYRRILYLLDDPEDLRHINNPISPELFKFIIEKYHDDTKELLKFVPRKFRTTEICKISVNDDGWTLNYVPENSMTYEICKTAVNQQGYALALVPKELITPELCELAVTEVGLALKYVPEELKTLELCKIAVNRSVGAIKYCPNEIFTRESHKSLFARNLVKAMLTHDLKVNEKREPEKFNFLHAYVKENERTTVTLPSGQTVYLTYDVTPTGIRSITVRPCLAKEE